MATEPDQVLVVGEALIDVTRAVDGSETAKVGGSPLNVAVGLARLDVPTVLAAQVGEDDYGEQIRDHVDASDVDLRSLPPHHQDTATAVAVLDQTGAAAYEFDLTWDPSELPTLEGFALVHVGSISTTLSPGADAVAALVHDAATQAVPVSVDPNVRATITPDLDDVRRRLEELMSVATIVKCSDEDVELLRPGLSPGEFADEVLASGAALVAITLGGEGALVADSSDQVRIEAADVRVVDTIGAGDSFMSALIAAVIARDWLQHDTHPIEELRALGQFCIDAAAVTVSRPGADPPWLSELSSTPVAGRR